jgi:hypothetical protein
MFMGETPKIRHSTQEKDFELKQPVLNLSLPLKPPAFCTSPDYFNIVLNVTATQIPISLGKYGNKTRF